MMEQTVYKIGEVSARLGLLDKNSNTLRGWTEEFGEFLTQAANPPPGQPRRYTERDVHVLLAVRDYRANHLTYEEIRARLRAGEHDVTPRREESAERPEPSYPSGAHATLAPLPQVETLLAPLAASVEEWRRLAEQYRERLESREARIEMLERRLDDLYARLDGVQSAPPEHAAPPDHGGNSEDDQSIARVADEVSQAMPANGHVPHEVGDKTPHEDSLPLFPLPPIDRAEPVPATMTVEPEQGTRRHWWQVWR